MLNLFANVPLVKNPPYDLHLMITVSTQKLLLLSAVLYLARRLHIQRSCARKVLQTDLQSAKQEVLPTVLIMPVPQIFLMPGVYME